MKFSIKDFFSKCDQIRKKLRIWSHLLKKSLMENFIFFCAVKLSNLCTYFKLYIYQDNGKLLTNFLRSSLLMKNVITKWISANALVLLISSTTSSFPKTKAGNKQCTSRAPFVPAQLKLTDIPQSIIHEIYNEAKWIIENGSVLKGFWNIFLRTKHNRPK